MYATVKILNVSSYGFHFENKIRDVLKMLRNASWQQTAYITTGSTVQVPFTTNTKYSSCLRGIKKKIKLNFIIKSKQYIFTQYRCHTQQYSSRHKENICLFL